jgi:hypothetical protein
MTNPRRIGRLVLGILACSLFAVALLSYTSSETLAAGVCAPYGNPLPNSQYKGYNAFYLCSESKLDALNSWTTGRVELRILCNDSSLRKGWKWHIWCNPDGSSCGCNENDFNKGRPGLSCCQWSAGEHCTVNGEAYPGDPKGCAKW